MSQDFAECVGLLKAASECIQKMQATRGGMDDEKAIEKFREKQTRLEIASHIRQAAKCEKDACAILVKIIEKL